MPDYEPAYEIVDRRGNVRRAFRGEPVGEGEIIQAPNTDAHRVVPGALTTHDDTSGANAMETYYSSPHRPGFRFADTNEVRLPVANEAYEARSKRMREAWKKEREELSAMVEEHERKQRERDRRKTLASRGLFGRRDASTLDELEHAATQAYDERSRRMETAWQRNKGEQQDAVADERTPSRTATTDELQAKADQAWEDRNRRLQNAWRNRDAAA
jgi:hypothetical protein